MMCESTDPATRAGTSLPSLHRWPTRIATEDCGGPSAFLELRQRYSVVSITERLLELLSPLISDTERLDDDHDDGDDDDHDHHEELVELLRWLKIDRFDRRTVNRQLGQIDDAPTGRL